MWTGCVCLKPPLVLLHDSCVQFVGKELSYRPLSVDSVCVCVCVCVRVCVCVCASICCRLRGDAIGFFRRVARDINSFLQRGVTSWCDRISLGYWRGVLRFVNDVRVNPLTPTGYYMYHQFNIQLRCLSRCTDWAIPTHHIQWSGKKGSEPTLNIHIPLRPTYQTF